LFEDPTIRRVLGIAALSLALSACRGRDGGLPERYGDAAVPEAALASVEARNRGRALFLEHCALCHGERADGRGVRREGLTSPPRDFTDPAWRLRTSPRRVFFTIREGVRGTAMPGWAALGDSEVWDLVAYLRSVSGNRP
jgi:mono/diheme cytochrome c family protein